MLNKEIINIKENPLYTSFRAFMYTTKGKRAGVDPEWRNFRKFHHDMQESYIE